MIHREPVDDPAVVLEIAREVAQFLKDAQIPLGRFVRELKQEYGRRARGGTAKNKRR